MATTDHKTDTDAHRSEQGRLSIIHKDTDDDSKKNQDI